MFDWNHVCLALIILVPKSAVDRLFLGPEGRKSCLLATILMACLQPALVIFERPPEGFFAASPRGIFLAANHVGPEERG
jgi:hypothetical protein